MEKMIRRKAFLKHYSVLTFLIVLNCEISQSWKPIVPPVQPNDASTITYHGKLAPMLVANARPQQQSVSQQRVSTIGASSSSFYEQHVLPPNGISAGDEHQSILLDTSGFQNGGEHFTAVKPADPCGNHKVGFTQDLYFQYIQYKFEMPQLKEFTLCMWSKFTNHSNDHPLFSYAVDGQPRAILAWISNTDRSSYFSMAVSGHTFYRLNYPIRLNKWYHSCHSWNGRTGEWQLWVNAERVGRGFHNRLVGHTIPPKGILITGQEQRQLGGGFLEGYEAPNGSGGMLGEVTMVQLYKVALTAGKAHRNHKHHHAHKFLHEGVTTTTTPPPPTSTQRNPPLVMHPLLTAGQLNPMLNLNFAGGQPSQSPIVQQPQIITSGQTTQPFNEHLLNGAFLNQFAQQQTQQQNTGAVQFIPNDGSSNAIVSPSSSGNRQQTIFTNDIQSQLLNSPAVQFLETNTGGHQYLYKRENKLGNAGETSSPSSVTSHKIVKKRQAVDEDGTKHSKRGLVLVGDALYEDSALTSGTLDLPSLDGLAGIGDNQPVLHEQQEKLDHEPAEYEVRAVMNMCTGCDPEPFAKALVFGWRTVPKKIYSGAYYIPAAPQCKAF